MDRTSGIVALALVSAFGGVVARVVAQTPEAKRPLPGTWVGDGDVNDTTTKRDFDGTFRSSMKIVQVDPSHVRVDGAIELPHERITYSTLAATTLDTSFGFEVAIPPRTPGLVSRLFGGGKTKTRLLKGNYGFNAHPVPEDSERIEGMWEIWEDGGMTCTSFAEKLHRPGSGWKEFPMTGDWEKEGRIFEDLKAQVREIQAEVAKESAPARGFHNKGFGLKASFRVSPDIAPDLAVGFLAKPGQSYDAIARFSNASARSQSDGLPDQRGLAVRVKTGKFETLLSGAVADAQDFLTTNSPVTARDPVEFLAIARAQLDPLRLPKVVEKLGPVETAYATAKLARGLDVIHSMGQIKEWSSRAPLKWGSLAVKLRLAPTRLPGSGLVGDWNGKGLPFPKDLAKDHLRDDMAERLADVSDSLVMNVEVQRFESEKTTPIEDGSIEWKTPFEKVGELWFSRQEMNSEYGKELGAEIERLAFSPWNCTEDFRPLGRLMRSRKLAYAASAERRGACPFGFGR
jgi:hypothetical protein